MMLSPSQTHKRRIMATRDTSQLRPSKGGLNTHTPNICIDPTYIFLFRYSGHNTHCTNTHARTHARRHQSIMPCNAPQIVLAFRSHGTGHADGLVLKGTRRSQANTAIQIRSENVCAISSMHVYCSHAPPPSGCAALDDVVELKRTQEKGQCINASKMRAIAPHRHHRRLHRILLRMRWRFDIVTRFGLAIFRSAQWR